MKTFDINEELERVEGKLAERLEKHVNIPPLYAEDELDEICNEALEKVCDEVVESVQFVHGPDAEFTVRNWNAACKAVQARRVA